MNEGEVIEICGGFRERCLDEICILLEAAEVSYSLNNSLIYSLPEETQGSKKLQVPALIPWNSLVVIEEQERAPLLFPEFMIA